MNPFVCLCVYGARVIKQIYFNLALFFLFARVGIRHCVWEPASCGECGSPGKKILKAELAT